MLNLVGDPSAVAATHLDLSVSTTEPTATAPSVVLPVGNGRRPDLDHVRLVASTAIGDWLAGSPLRDIATLLVRELVTDAAWYGVPPLTLRMLRTAAGVRIEVQDAGQSPAVITLPVDDLDEAGCGPDEDAALMDTLADRWGIQRAAAGRCLWFELSTAGLARAGKVR